MEVGVGMGAVGIGTARAAGDAEAVMVGLCGVGAGMSVGVPGGNVDRVKLGCGWLVGAGTGWADVDRGSAWDGGWPCPCARRTLGSDRSKADGGWGCDRGRPSTCSGGGETEADKDTSLAGGSAGDGTTCVSASTGVPGGWATIALWGRCACRMLRRWEW
jgi:hypothetical protein